MAKLGIALDTMGGDNGPVVVVPAALKTLSDFPQLNIILVGRRDSIEAELRQHSALQHPRISIVEASEVVGMDEPPAVALRSKRDSSMRVAIDLVKDGKAEACVSAGNTGALMAIARFVLKMLPGVDRPAIVSALPTLTGYCYMLDLGANVDCEAKHLFQFAVMGAVLAKAANEHQHKQEHGLGQRPEHLQEYTHPKVGLLNVGSEAIKGSEPVKRAAELLSQLNKKDINYIGYVEGDDIYSGTVDVVVCDGFVGNVALKASEGVVKMVFKTAKQEFTRHWYARFVAFLALPLLKSLKNRFDPGRYNGASLLGLRGIVIKSHGNADVLAFSMAIRRAILEVEKNIPDKIQNQVSAFLGMSETP